MLPLLRRIRTIIVKGDGSGRGRLPGGGFEVEPAAGDLDGPIPRPLNDVDVPDSPRPREERGQREEQGQERNPGNGAGTRILNSGPDL